MQDERIVALYWERDEAALTATQEKYDRYLTKVAYNILADLEDSRESVNDTYLAAWNSIPPHKPSVLSTYLGKITRRLSIDRLRKRRSEKRQASEYAFVALLPNAGVSVSDYVASLDGETLRAILSSAQETKVVAALPKFETEYSADMSAILEDMGMSDAFNVEKADFSSLGRSTKGNIFIDRVVHKTFISVAEQGTKAGAATAVTVIAGSAIVPKPKTVTLDRPFVYMLIDLENRVPFFIGTMMDVNG